MKRTEYREQKCRRILRKAGMELHKSCVRNPWDDRYHMYMIVGHYLNGIPTDSRYNMELDEIEEFIKDNVEPIMVERSRH